MLEKSKVVPSQKLNIVTRVNEWQHIRKTLDTRHIGFIPTMGNLHAGHLQLCERAKQENEITVVSIFVNPTQFNQGSDFTAYPRTLEADTAKLSQLDVDYLLLFSTEELYPDKFEMRVIETNLSLDLEGKYRPMHFTGMLTIVLKLFNLVYPSRAYFGEKDYQQLLLVEKLIKAFFLPITLVSCATVREPTGLALSSRNARLSAADKALAFRFHELLKSELSVDQIKYQLTSLGFKVEYIEEKWQRRLGAVWLGEVRLIDNVSLSFRA